MPRGHSKKARRQRERTRKKGGLLTGMRTGFKSAADTVTGSKPKKTNRIVSTVITLILLAAVIALIAQGRC